MTENLSGASIHINGIVQGVGFRPFVYGLATRLALKGWVRNTSAGVDIDVDGEPGVLETFIHSLRIETPPLARIDELIVTYHTSNNYTSFEIVHSEAIADAFQPISPDVSICPDCLRELFDPDDRRYRYPFINCTNCGPRFTIIQDIPYDRPKTTMAPFEMCPDCAAEYTDPADRRFHAQPVACPVCGPKVWLEIEESRYKDSTVRSTPENTNPRWAPSTADSQLEGDDAIQATRELLTNGSIVAIKGLGGFHLACDATNVDAVSELRQRKLRVDKPFALMMPDIETIERHCQVDASERALLQSTARPIVLLRRKPESPIAQEVAPGQDTLGVMLPYTPLHYLLFAEGSNFPERNFPPLVMTSGNLSEEPIAIDNRDARQRLSQLADAFLMHNREIHIRCDDSVVRVVDTRTDEDQAADVRYQIYPLRRSRGYAPFPVKLPRSVPQILAAGAELKNTFCISNQNYAFLSHHIGDLENYETLRSFEQGVEHFERLFRVKPETIAYDLHPNYLATRYALERGQREDLTLIGVQHHHAHIAACMAEHGLGGDRTVIGLSFDGTGYGEDGAIWGGEVLLADYQGYQRPYHLAYFPLPGGDAAIRHPARTALGLLWTLGLEWDERLAPVAEYCADDRTTLRTQLEHSLNTPSTSSLGRLFDAAAALAGVRQKVNYEAQAAIEFEALADPAEAGVYPFELDQAVIGVRTAVEALVADVLAGVPTPSISARFHNGLAQMALEVCNKLRADTSLQEVALSGGVWQNITLLGRTLSLLHQAGFRVYIHQQVPTNDGGLSLGQLVVAASKLRG